MKRKREVNEQFGKKMNQDVDGNKKLFWKEVNGGKGESCSKMKNGNGRLVLGADEVRIIWKDYFEDLLI